MQRFRRYTPWIAGTAVAGFLVWLVATAASVRPGERAGFLFGKAISADEYVRSLGAVTRDAILRHGDRWRQEAKPEELEQRAWERLILLKEARSKRIRVSDREVVAELGRSPLFLGKDGRFDREGYPLIIQHALGATPRTFEEDIRQTLMIQKLVGQSIPEPAVTEEEILEAFKKEKESKKPADDSPLDAAGKERIKKELEMRKRFQAYLAWYEDLLRRAAPKKPAADALPRPVKPKT